MDKKVLLICAGGMSTGILMKKMEKYAAEQGFVLQIEAVGMSVYEEVYKNYDVILLGPQVSYKKAEIEEVTKMPIAVIAAYDYAVGNVANIMKQVDELYK
jgi:PTS system cellobiose-specific IIB component